MSNSSWRLSVKEVDLSSSTRPTTNNIGATVIEALKGPVKPVYIERGNTNKLATVFGEPTALKPQVFDALEYVKEAPIWVSAPNKNGKYGGVLVTKTGTEALTSGVSSNSLTFSAIDVIEDVATGDDSTTTFTLNLADYTHYNNQSLIIKLNNTELTNFSISDAALEVIAADELISGGYNRSTGLLTLTFDTAPTASDTITAEYTVDRSSDAYFAIFTAAPQADDLSLLTSYDSINSRFTLQISLLVDGVYTQLSDSPYLISLTEGAKDDFGSNIYIEDVFLDNPYISYSVNTNLTPSTFQASVSRSDLLGIGDGSTKTFSTTLNNFSTYDEQTIDITVAGTTINVSASDADPEVLTTSPDVGDGTYNRTTGVVSFTFDTAPADNANIRTTYTTLESTDGATVDLNGGNRGDSISGSDYLTGWNYFQNSNTYAADIFFDISANPNIPGIFNDLASTYQQFKAYILPLPRATAASVKATKTSYGVTNRNVYYYWNWLRVENVYKDSSLWSPCIGPIAVKHAQMVDVFNGLAPAWIDENGHGGQLSVRVLDQAYDPDESTLRDLDINAHINPIHNDKVYGPMIKSHRTSLSGNGDYSYISHSRLADYIISNITTQVLPYQYIKLNDIIHRDRVQKQADSIVAPLTAVPNQLLFNKQVICDETNNTPAILAARKFVLAVYIQFTPTSELIDFYVINTPAGAEITGNI